ncbi:hypothetical protein HYD74_00945 [Mycoplasmopsis bovis]|nr:hypothetical protein HYD74_00945 [Mycoplasmopsis bovis]
MADLPRRLNKNIYKSIYQEDDLNKLAWILQIKQRLILMLSSHWLYEKTF